MNREEILRRVKALPGHIGLYIDTLDGGETIAYQADEPIEAASVIKLTVMAEAFRQREAGTFDFAEPVTIRPEDKLPSCGALTYLHDGLTVQWGDLVTLMIILSDNTATNLLIDRLGSEAINGMIDSLSLTGTRLRRKLFQPELAARGIINTVTARDMGVLLTKLLRGEVVSASASQEMMTLLYQQRLNGKLPFYLHGEGIRVAHKTGEDDGLTHDVGYIAAKRPCVVCFLSERTNVPRAERAMQEIAALAAGVAL